MSPTVFKEKNYSFHFFSREENRIHVHIISPDGEAKFLLEPTISLVNYSGFSKQQLNFLQKTVERRKDEIIKKWKNTLKVEITNISEHGFWILLADKEYFLPFEKYPWFKKAKISAITNLQILRSRHLYWPELDVRSEH